MTLTLSLIAAALLFVTFGMLRAPDRCDRNCGSESCSTSCRGTKENQHHV